MDSVRDIAINKNLLWSLQFMLLIMDSVRHMKTNKTIFLNIVDGSCIL
jgi:hypothetical protein